MGGNGSFTVGDWLVEPELNRISRDDSSTSLRPQVMELLVYLAKQQGRVAKTEDLLNDLWAGKIVTDGTVYNCVAELRHLLADRPDGQTCIETIPKKGYRLLAPVTGLDEARQPADVKQEKGWSKRRLAIAVGAGTISALLAAVIASYLIPAPPPTVTGYTQLTKSVVVFPPPPSPLPLVNDGSRIYFNDWEAGRLLVRQLSQAGGEAIRVTSPFDDPAILFNPQAMSPDGSQLLVNAFKPGERGSTLWLWPVVGGDPRRLGDGGSAAYSPDGTQLVYEVGRSDIHIARADLTESRKLVTVSGRVYWPSFSPDGHRIRFTVSRGLDRVTLWEMMADGSALHRLLPEWDYVLHCCGSWTADGQYYVFQATKDHRSQIWAIHEQAGALGNGWSEPYQLTTGAMEFVRPTIAADGKTIFAIGWQLRGELARYDRESGRFVPVPGLESLSAEWVAYSRDEEWIAYASHPEAELWRSKSDGNNRLQLTSSPMRAFYPVWSPDGETIAFSGWLPDENWNIYLVSADGGSPGPITAGDRDVYAPSWSPDGMSLAFNADGKDTIQIYDLATETVSELDGSDGLIWPRWSPDGRFLAAYSDGRLQLFEFATGRSEELIEIEIGPFSSLYWAGDSSHIYYNEPFWRADGRRMQRVNINDGSVEQVALVGSVWASSTWGVYGMWVGVTPDGLPMLLRDLSIQHIYALDWQPD